VCILCLLRGSNLCDNQTNAVFKLKLIVGWGEHKVVPDKSGIRAYRVDMDWGLNYPSIKIIPLLNNCAIYPSFINQGENNGKNIGSRNDWS